MAGKQTAVLDRETLEKKLADLKKQSVPADEPKPTAPDEPKIPAKAKAAKPNSVNIYPDSIKYEFIENPVGRLHTRRNDGKRFYMHRYNPETKQLEPLILPDGQYRNPKIMSIPVEMPANKRLFRRRPGLWQQLTPALLLGAGVLLAFLIIVTGG